MLKEHKAWEDCMVTLVADYGNACSHLAIKETQEAIVNPGVVSYHITLLRDKRREANSRLLQAIRSAPTAAASEAVVMQCAEAIANLREGSRDSRFRSALTIAAGHLREQTIGAIDPKVIEKAAAFDRLVAEFEGKALFIGNTEELTQVGDAVMKVAVPIYEYRMRINGNSNFKDALLKCK